MTLLLVTALAGGAGGASRFLVDTALARAHRTRLPLGTMTVNVSACLLLGLLTGYALAHGPAGELPAVAGVGFLGGYSTFSTASVEAVRLLRTGSWGVALVYAGGMLLLGLLASALGMLVGGLLP
ncbi:CrcB family protein [Nocardiopsis sp. CC223A]|uniref:fluoride efflux transporter FluC n=1 Tax=Nocardiopsis sp. CC223A TaxID=3044051 RepID=UPI00278BBA9C|nr:CrcB family protein [Nocardiopsis sp. CC223A]